MRHLKQQLESWSKWHTKPSNHRFWKVLSALDVANTCFMSPLQRLAKKFGSLGDLSNLEKFDAYIQPPWLANATGIIPSRAEAIAAA